MRALDVADSEGLKLEPIFENHLAFLAAHRGRLYAGENWFALEGDAPFLSFFTPLTPEVKLPADCPAVWLYPWSGEQRQAELTRLGFSPAGAMSYMELFASSQADLGACDAVVEIVRSDAQALEFASVQARGFLTDQSSDREWWANCFAQMALRNYARPDQTFFLARVDSKPAAILLSIRTGQVTGIYAVATDPDYRCAGLSSALLKRAHGEAIARGVGKIVLQAMAGEYAQQFYGQRGFEERYVCHMWQRQ